MLACATPPSSTLVGTNKLGVHLLLDDGRFQWPVSEWETHLDYARQAVGAGGMVTELVRLDDLDVAKWQQFMDLCAVQQLTPILRLATTFDREAGWWKAPPLDANGRSYQTVAQEYANFVAALDWPSEHHFVLVGNEPNHGDEWSGRPDPAAYARFLLDTAVALKAADPQVFVLNAGLDPYTPHTGGTSIPAPFYWKWSLPSQVCWMFWTVGPAIRTRWGRLLHRRGNKSTRSIC